MAKFAFKSEPISKFVVPQNYREEHEDDFDAAMSFLADYVKGWDIYNILQFNATYPIKQFWGELVAVGDHFHEVEKRVYGYYIEINPENIKIELYKL